MSKKSILIFGGTGMLGSEFFTSAWGRFDIAALSRDEADVRDFPSVLNQISLHSPDLILNLAWYTDVEGAEGEGFMEAYQVNALGAQNVAKAAAAFGVPLIYVSTDYVFDGKKSQWYTPVDAPHPLSNYGMSKYLGEVLSQKELRETIIVRTSALYGKSSKRKHFIEKIREKGSSSSHISVVDDAYTFPTNITDLASALATLIEEAESYEWHILHLVNESSDGNGVSWYEYARQIQTHTPDLPQIQPISRSALGGTVERPQYALLKNTSDIKLPEWRDSLERYLKNT